MSPAKIWLTTFLVGFAAIAALLVVTLVTPVAYGDLARIGMLSEHEFGWRVDQPHVDPKFIHGSPANESDVLVVGDSFSMTYRWQSALTKAGYKVTTVYWTQLDETLCSDFDAWLDRAGFHGKLVVIESIERLLPERLEKMRTCKRMQPFVTQPDPYFTYPETVPGFSLNWKAKLMSGYNTYFNTRKARQSASVIRSKDTLVRPVADGCRMFSHRFCGKALFFIEDEQKRELTVQDVDVIRDFNRAHPVRPILWLVIPNKTTTYLTPGHAKGFVAAFTASNLGPDLFAFAFEKKTSIRDFYFPNDTHLSMHGQLALGDLALEWVRRTVPKPGGEQRIGEPSRP